MRHCCKLQAATIVRCWLLPGGARVVFGAAFVALLASMTTGADDQHSIVARVDPKSAGLTPRQVAVRVGDITVPATAIRATPEIPRNVAIVMDAGPDQSNVLSKEKELAVALINEMSDSGTSFTIASAGVLPKVQVPTPERSIAMGHIRDITADSGSRKTNIPIYDAIGLTIQKVSVTPGLRIVIFIGEGNDGASKLRYAELRNLAESNQIAFLAALVADHSLRGTKSILRYGRNLQELTSDTAGIFLENQKTPKAVGRLTESIRNLRLIALDMPSRQPGRFKISVSTLQGKRLRAQKHVVIP